MYTRFFGLTEKPFAITPDPAYLYMSERHAEALAHLIYGVTESGGFIQLTGEVGTGKTTLTRGLLDRLPEHVDIALILNPRLTVREFLTTIFDELHLEALPRDATIKDLVDALNRHLLESHSQGRRTVLLVDEAQNLDAELLEQLRLLTNLETTKHKLLQIILVGQPELRNTLARTDLRQIAQRITGRYHLETLNESETASYVRHRLTVAGGEPGIFAPAALREIHRCTGGVPRLINVVCDRSLLGAYTGESRQVTPAIVRRAAGEVSGARPASPAPRFRWGAVAAATLVVMVILAGWVLLRDPLPPASVNASELKAPPTRPVMPAIEPTNLPSLTLAMEMSVPPVAAVDAPAINVESKMATETDYFLTAVADTGTDQAFRTIFSLWGAPYQATAGPPCVQAKRQGLKCEYQQGSWGQLRSLDRPAILSLVDSRGDLHHVVAQGLDDTTVMLRLGDRTEAVPLRDADRFWFGEYLLLWRPQPGADQLMLPGNRSDGIRWLRQSLESLQGGPTRLSNADYYDDTLVERVRKFQASNGLEADGKAGVQTLVALNVALAAANQNGAGSPRLGR